MKPECIPFFRLTPFLRRSEKRRNLFDAQDAVDARKDGLLFEIDARLQRGISRLELFTVRW